MFINIICSICGNKLGYIMKEDITQEDRYLYSETICSCENNCILDEHEISPEEEESKINGLTESQDIQDS